MVYVLVLYASFMLSCVVLCVLTGHHLNTQIIAKTMFVPSGAEIPNHARSLALHFQTQGTPVMIGIEICHLLRLEATLRRQRN